MEKKSKAIDYTPDILRKLQQTQLEILVEFDRVCRKNNIKYYLACGTLLGAIRHNGFIPWDDDVDVWMLREDYDLFGEIAEHELNNDYFFQTWNTDPFFNSAYGKIRDKRTKYVRAGQEKMKYKDGIYIDVLPLDNTPDEMSEHKAFAKKCLIFRKLTYAKAGAMCEENTLKRVGFFMLSLYPTGLAKKQFDRLIRKYDKKETTHCKCLGDFGMGYHLKEDFRETIEWEFEGHMFLVPKGYDSVLKNSFGKDYMELPPQEEQRPHAEASYIEFGEE